MPVLAQRRVPGGGDGVTPGTEVVALGVTGQDRDAGRAQQPPTRASPPPLGGGRIQSGLLGAVVRLKQRTTESIPAAVTVDTDAGVDL
ncbi:MAG: hypothetical protein ACRDRF_20100 [Pseudonocardiaceae bacterium]